MDDSVDLEDGLLGVRFLYGHDTRKVDALPMFSRPKYTLRSGKQGIVKSAHVI